jgi:thioredoxin-like negative regulator of GroEL
MTVSLTEPNAGRGPADVERPKLLFVVSATSGRSRRTEGFLAQVLQRRGNHNTFDLVRIDAEARGDLLGRLRVTEIPTLLVVEDRHVRARLTTPRGCEEIRAFLAPWLR